MNDQLLARIDALEQEIKNLKADSTIPYDVDQAFRKRLAISTFTPFVVSAKGASTEDVSVNEGGASSYAVMNDPDGFLEVTIANTVYYVPYFD